MSLDLEPVDGKKIKIILIENENPVNWDYNKESIHIGSITDVYLKFLGNVIADRKIDIIAEEGIQSQACENIKSFSIKKNIKHVQADIDDNALGYIKASDDLSEILNNLSNEINTTKSDNVNYETLKLWHNYLTQKHTEFIDDLSSRVREAWMMSCILKEASRMERYNLNIVLVTDIKHFGGIVKLCEDLDIQTEEITIEKIYNSIPSSLYELSTHPPILEIKVKKIEKSQSKKTKILYFMDTDEYCSPFDLNMAYDSGFDQVVQLPRITPHSAAKLTADAIFSRGPDGTNHTAFFLGGNDVILIEKILEAVKGAMFPPFECPVFLDPRGAYTTASAAVVKSLSAFDNKSLLGRNVVIMGAGPVGRIASIILSKIGAKVILVETAPEKFGGSVENVDNIVNILNNQYSLNCNPIKSAFAPDMKSRKGITFNCEVIYSMGVAGIEIIDEEILINSNAKIVLDINATPPYGISGIKPSMDKKPLKCTVGLTTEKIGIGALSVGALKRDTEYSILKEIINNGHVKKVYGIMEAFEASYKIIFEDFETSFEYPIIRNTV